MMETFRVYEALENGCIPIVERRWGLAYFDRLFSEHPIPTVDGWMHAARRIEDWARDPQELHRIQRKVSSWWQEYKRKLREGVSDFVRRGLRGEWSASLRKNWRFRSGRRYELWRRLEPLRHHTLGAAIDRMRRSVLERGPTTLWKGGPRFKDEARKVENRTH